MRKGRILLALLMASTASLAGLKVVYGKDNRKEYYQVNSFLKKLADATAGMIENGTIQEENQSYRIFSHSTLGESENLCEGEKFADQPLAPMCSGFLVGEDTLVTAGHCFETLWQLGYFSADAVCEGFSWVFDYHVDSKGKVNRKDINKNNVYKCSRVVKSVFDPERNLDFAVIKLDRKVTGRAPIKYRTEGKIKDKTSLVVIGHPSGLPTKISDGGTILVNDKAETFTTTLDTFHGNSGSAVFDARTGLIEGILVSGKTDYAEISDGKGGMCTVVNVCDMNGENCLSNDQGSTQVAGEEVTRITQLTEYIEL